MNYFLMRFTPTKRLRRGRACPVGGAQQSCLARPSPRPRSRIKQKSASLAQKATRSFNPLSPAGENTFCSGPKSSKRPCFAPVFVNERRLEEYSCGGDAGGLIHHLRGLSLTQRARLFSFWGCKSHFLWSRADATEPGSVFFLLLIHPQGTMRR